MNFSKKLMSVAFALSIMATTAIAQKEKPGNEKNQEIIIRKGDSKGEKMIIVIDGDKITLNGKPIDKDLDVDVKILKRDGDNYAPRARAFRFDGDEVRNKLKSIDGFSTTVGNKAMLGVVTMEAEGGAKITEVTEESGAGKAGLKVNDIIIRVGDKKIENSNDLIAAIGSHKPNDKVEVSYKRNGKNEKTTAMLSENKMRSFSLNGSFEGMDIPGMQLPFGEAFTFNRKPKVGLQIMDVEEGSGVQIREVENESAASKAGLKEGDVITELNGKSIAGVDAMKEQIKDIKEGDLIKMTYRRGGNTQIAEVKIPKKLKTANL